MSFHWLNLFVVFCSVCFLSLFDSRTDEIFHFCINLTFFLSGDVFTCGDCGRLFSWPSSLRLHQKVACGKMPNFYCTMCDYKTHFKGNLKRHVNGVHRTKIIWVICEIVTEKTRTSIKKYNLVHFFICCFDWHGETWQRKAQWRMHQSCLWTTKSVCHYEWCSQLLIFIVHNMNFCIKNVRKCRKTWLCNYKKRNLLKYNVTLRTNRLSR